MQECFFRLVQDRLEVYKIDEDKRLLGGAVSSTAQSIIETYRILKSQRKWSVANF
jgi:hypothetical protein